MPYLKRLGIVFGVGLFVLMGCIPQAPVTTVTSTYVLKDFVIALTGRFTGYSKGERDAACEDIVPFDGQQAFRNTGGSSPIIWTFGVNFNVLSSQGDPLGCLKIYEANGSTYVLIHAVESSYLVDTCTRPGPTPPAISSGQAVFDGTGYIECAMNIDEWMLQISNTTAPADPLRSLLQTFFTQQIHDYPSFTMVARASLPRSLSIPTPTPWPTNMPLMSYAGNPPGQLTATPVDQPLLALVPRDTSLVDFGACTLPSLASTPVKDYYWWYDVRITPTNEYVYSPDYDPTLVPKPTVVSCGTGNAVSPVRIWDEEAILYIGYDPDTANLFQGSIDGLLIDPPNSKPPE